jgi:hypothetical protein
MSDMYASNPRYVKYERLLQELHHLMAEGKGDTEEADALREEMDEPWWALRREERARLDGLSADLYMLQDQEVFEPLDPSERTPERLGVALKAAWDQGDWESLLELLRKGPMFLSPERIAYIRARAYEALGHHETARLFREYAARCHSQDTTHSSQLFQEIS